MESDEGNALVGNESHGPTHRHSQMMRERGDMESKTLTNLLSAQPLVRDLNPLAAQTVVALRYAILCRKTGHDPVPQLARRWGNPMAARRLSVLIEAIGHIWPDPFAIAPPCCSRVSFDEALFAAMVSATFFGDRFSFDQMSAEMLNGDERDMLFACIQNFLRIAPPHFH